ncbi:MAG: tetratricopeptide repeat protein [Gemmataceae bacterium]
MKHLPMATLLVVFWGLWSGVSAQEAHRPKSSPGPNAEQQREARRLYGVGLLYERRNRLLEALRSLEAAHKLDPASPAIARALVPLYVGLDRLDDAVSMAERVLQAEPNDYSTARLIAQQLRAANRLREASQFLIQATASTLLKQRPEVAAEIWFDRGLIHEQLHQWDQAEVAFRTTARLFDDPRVIAERTAASETEVKTQAAEVYERLGRVLLEQKRLEEARQAFAAARKADPRQATRLAYDLARVFRDAGRLRESLEQLEEYLRGQPSGLEAYEMRLALQRQLGIDPLPSLQRSSDRDPNNLPLRLLYASELVRAKQTRQAEEVYLGLLRDSTDPSIYRGLFALYAQQGQAGARKVLLRLNASIGLAVGQKDELGDPTHAAHVRAMLQTLRSHPQLVRRLLALAVAPSTVKLDYATRVTLGSLAARTGELATAEKLYRSCLEARADELSGSESELYSGLLQVLQLAHQHTEVIQLADQGLEKAQNTNRVLFHRAKAYAFLGLGKADEALKAAEAAVAESGKAQRLGSRKLRAYILGEIGRPREAIAECLAMQKDYPSGSELRDVRLALSRALAAAGRHDEAEAQLERMLESDPTDATVCNDLGYGLANCNKDLQRAEKLIRRALELDRQQRHSGTEFDVDADLPNAAYLDSLGWVLFRQGRLAEAQRLLEQAVSLPQGDDPVLWDHLGDVYARRKLHDKARAAWTKAIQLFRQGVRYPGDPRHQEIQEKLRVYHP